MCYNIYLLTQKAKLKSINNVVMQAIAAIVSSRFPIFVLIIITLVPNWIFVLYEKPKTVPALCTNDRFVNPLDRVACVASSRICACVLIGEYNHELENFTRLTQLTFNVKFRSKDFVLKLKLH